MPARPGLVHVVAPSGPVPADRLQRALPLLTRALGQPTLAPNLEVREGYFAGNDALRLASLDAALRDDRARVVWAARGGYGLTRLIDRLDPGPLRERAKLIVGFSDVTALLCWAYVACGRPSLHGPVVAQLAELPPEDVERVLDLIAGELASPLVAEDDAMVLHGGRVEGPLIVGNLEMLRSLIGTPIMPSLHGAILAIEEVGERPYRIDRALTQLLASGSLRGVRGVAVGQLHRCGEPDGGGSLGMTAREVIEDRLARLGVPVVVGLPFGHLPTRNAALAFGVTCRLDASLGMLEQLEPLPSALD